MTTIPATLGAKRDRHDARDYVFTPAVAAPPPAIDLRRYCLQVYNQLPLPSCAAHATASAMAFVAAKARRTLAPSRLFIYYNARLRERGESQNNGTTIRNAIKAAAKPGACAETSWNYDPANVEVEPPKSAYDAIVARAASYYRLPQLLRSVKSCLAEGFPVIFGVNVYTAAIYHAQTTGELPIPSGTDSFMGGHAVLAVGYDDASENVMVLNSLGASWGANGYMSMPYDYFTNPDLTFDFWTIRELA